MPRKSIFENWGRVKAKDGFILRLYKGETGKGGGWKWTPFNPRRRK